MRKNFGAKTYLYPLPVLIVAAYDENGTPNAMNAAWGGISDDNQVALCLSAGHKTTKNILAKGAFTVSMADAAHVVECDYLGVVSGNKEPNKLAKAGLHAVKSEFVDAPVIEELPMTLECKLIKVTQEGLILGEIVNVSADESILDKSGKIDPAKLRPITFDPVNNKYIQLGEVVGNVYMNEGETLPPTQMSGCHYEMD